MRLPRYRFGEFEIDPASRELARNGERVALPPKSFDCLTYLISHRERAVGRDELIAAVWGKVEVSDTVVAQTLLRARKVLDDSGERQAMIRTVPRFGYRWVAAVEEVQPAEIREPEAPAQETVQPIVASAPDDGRGVLPQDASTPATDADSAAVSKPGRRRGILWLSILMLLAVMVAGIAAWWLRDPSPIPGATGDLVAVLPVTVDPASPESTWVRLGAMDYMASRLRRAGMKVLPSDQTLHLSAHVEDLSTLGDDDWRRLQADTGARWLLLPQARHGQGGWRIHLLVREGGKVHALDAQAGTPLAAAAEATDAWLRRLNLAGHAVESLPSPLVERIQRVDAELLAGQVGAARNLIESAPADQRSDPGLRVREGQLEYRAGHMPAASAIFGQLLALQPPVDADIRAKALMGQGAIAIRRSDFAVAEQRYTDALEVLERDSGLEAPALVGNAYNGRGVARVNQGKMEEAVSDMGLARVSMQRSGDFVEAAMVGSNLGAIEVLRGHYPQALQEFDNAIEVFDRFDVHDYLAATLMAKAQAQLDSVQPEQAGATIARTGELVDALEDAELAGRIRVAQVRIQLANGQLARAAQGIQQLQPSVVDDVGMALLVQELRLRLGLAQADEEAGLLAREVPPADVELPEALPLAAVQAALRRQDLATARTWVQRAGQQDGNAIGKVGLAIARALLAQAQGNDGEAQRLARVAQALAQQSGNPRLRVQSGLLQAQLLTAAGNPEGAAAILGDLDAFGRRDYGVAWAVWALYRQMQDTAMIETSRRRVDALRGERDLGVPPVL